MSTGRSRRLIGAGPLAFAAFAAFSKDGAHLAYTWSTPTSEELRLIGVHGEETQKPRTLVADPAFRRVTPKAWSTAGEFIAVELVRVDFTRQIAVVSAGTGAVRVLKTLGGRANGGGMVTTSGMRFSPDDHYLLFDTLGSDTGSDIGGIDLRNGSDIVVDAFPGDDSLLGFTPDGTHVVFQSARSGTAGLWMAPFNNGVTGRPELVKNDIRMKSGVGLSSTGSLFYVPAVRKQTDVRMGMFDVRSGRFPSPPVEVTTDAVGTNVAPKFSPDGKSLAFLSERPQGRVVVIQTVMSGERLEFRLPLRDLRQGNTNLWKWNAAGTGLYAVGTSASGQNGIHYIDVATGKLAWSIPAGLPGLGLPDEVDDKRLTYSIGWEGAREFSLFEWDIATKTSKELYRTVDECFAYRQVSSSLYCIKGGAVVRRDVRTMVDTRIVAFGSGYRSVSPDGKYLVTHPSALTLLLTDLQTGRSRELARPERAAGYWWAPGNTAMLASKANETWWIPLDGSAPHRIPEMDDAVFAPHAAPYSADGRLAFEVSAGPLPPTELWVLENFLPAAVRKPGTR